MALGAVTSIVEGQSFAVEILASAIAANGIPTASAGVEMNALKFKTRVPDQIRVAVKSTAGSGTMTVTLRVWFRFGQTIGWCVGKALAASSAAPQTAVAIAETGTDSIAYSEVVECPVGADRIYLEIVAIAGTSTAVTGYAIVAPSFYA